jgi:ribosomal protein S18 acetylase RimI-like enzyme
MTHVRIRELRRRDRDAVIALDALHTGTPQRAYWTRLFRAFLAPGHADSRIGVVAELGGDLVGFLLAEVREGEFGSEPCGWILEVGVQPALSRAGVASRLLDEATTRLAALGIATVRTMVRRTNVPVLTFFRTNGFSGGPYVQLERALPPEDSDA